jgi:hypothetical protein
LSGCRSSDLRKKESTFQAWIDLRPYRGKTLRLYAGTYDSDLNDAIPPGTPYWPHGHAAQEVWLFSGDGCTLTDVAFARTMVSAGNYSGVPNPARFQAVHDWAEIVYPDRGGSWTLGQRYRLTAAST